ncbi:MAG: replication-relaxation family protein [Solirubrobacterales bacterium]|nr:replication-relaxation family protein [Solirubrobacterales bacterium]
MASGGAVDFDPGATSLDDGDAVQHERPDVAPETFTELDLEEVRGIVWDKVTPLPPDKRHDPSNKELEILGALWKYRVLFASQIHRRWWKGSSLRAAQQTLNKMTKAGWVRRFKFQLGERGAQQRVYSLTRLGFEMGQERLGRRGNFVDPDATWREPVMTDPRRILRDLHVNGWVMAFDARAGRVLQTWRGPRESRLEPPRRKDRGEWLDIDPRTVVVGSAHKLRDFTPHKFESVSPDATLELRISAGKSSLRFDLLVELDRTRGSAASEERLRRYDGLISGWSGLLERYKTLGTPPMVVFVCEDEKVCERLIRVADRTVVTRLAKPGADESEWPFPGRRGIFFVVERDIHDGSLEGYQLPELPPEIRVRLHGRRASRVEARRVHVIEPKLVDFH